MPTIPCPNPACDRGRVSVIANTGGSRPYAVDPVLVDGDCETCGGEGEVDSDDTITGLPPRDRPYLALVGGESRSYQEQAKQLLDDLERTVAMLLADKGDSDAA